MQWGLTNWGYKMSDKSEDTRDAMTVSGATAHARSLLKAGEDVGVRVGEAIDARTRAISEAWMAMATLICALTLILSSASVAAEGWTVSPGIEIPRLNIIHLLLVPFFVASMLEMGLRDQLPAEHTRATRLHGRRVSTASALALVVLLLLSLFPGGISFPILVGIVALAVLPLSTLALQSALRAREAGVRRSAATLLAPLSVTGRVVTLVLGTWLGVLGAAAGLSSSIAWSIASAALILAIMSTRDSRWGLSRLAQEWGRVQWIAFGCTFLLMNVLAAVLARTDWDLTIVGFVGGICVAVPLVVASFRPAPIREA